MAWWPASFNIATTVFLCGVVSDFLCVIFWQASCDGFHYLTNAMFPYTGFGIPNTGGGSSNYSQIERCRILHSFWLMF